MDEVLALGRLSVAPVGAQDVNRETRWQFGECQRLGVVADLVARVALDVVDGFRRHVLAQQLAQAQQRLPLLLRQVQRDGIELVDAHHRFIAAAGAHELAADGAAEGRWDLLRDLLAPHTDPSRAPRQPIQRPVRPAVTFAERVAVALTHRWVARACGPPGGHRNDRRRRILQRGVSVVVVVQHGVVDGLVFVHRRLIRLGRLRFRPHQAHQVRRLVVHLLVKVGEHRGRWACWQWLRDRRDVRLA